MGMKWRSHKRSPLTVVQNIQETSITVVEQNLGTISQLAALAESQFAQLVTAQLALAAQVQGIKDNIRINHFRSRFSTVNTVIVTVATVVDSRDASGVNNRYYVNQLLADNGFPERQATVMVSEVQTMTIDSSSATSGLEALLKAAGISAAAAPTSTPIFAAFDPNAPFGQLNQSIILPPGSPPPSIANIFVDPAAIIFPGQAGLFVENAGTFLNDCRFYSSNGNSFFNWASQLFTSFTQISVITLSGLSPVNVFGNSGFNTIINSATASVTSTVTAAAVSTAVAAAGVIPTQVGIPINPNVILDNPEG